MADVHMTLKAVAPAASLSLAAQATLGGGALQGVGGIWYAGAWCGYGFHEDGIASAVKAVGGLCGGRSVTPWAPVSCQSPT